MRIPKALAMVFCAGVFLLSSTLKADEWDKKTIITFSGPVMVQKTLLPAGTYVFKLADNYDRNIVRIFNEDETHVIATILAIPDYRIFPTGKTVIKFSEANNGETVAEGSLPETGIPIKRWFYPGDLDGQEFKVYPQPMVAEVQPPPPAPEPEAAPAPEPEAEAPEAAPAPEPQPEAEAPPEEPAAPPQTEEQPAPAVAQPAAPEELPQTASQMPLVGLIGILGLAAAASLRIFLKISA